MSAMTKGAPSAAQALHKRLHNALAWLALPAGLALLSAASTALAQAPETTEPRAQQRRSEQRPSEQRPRQRPPAMPRYSLRLKGQYADGFQERDGRDLSYLSGEAEANAILMMDPFMMLLSLGTEQRDYRGSLRGLGNQPHWGNSTQVSLLLNGKQKDGPWGWTLSGSLVSGRANGGAFGESLYGAAIAGITYEFAGGLTFGGLLIVSTNLGDSTPFILPFPVIRYRFDARWSLGMRRDGLALIYSFAPFQELYASFNYERRQYRLDAEPSGVAHSEGVLLDSRVPLTLGMTLRLGHGLSLNLAGGAYVYHIVDIIDRSGLNLDSLTLPVGAFGTLEATLRF